MRLLCRKYHFLENSRYRILVKKFFWPNIKISVYLLLIKNRKKIILFKSAISIVNLIWNGPYIVWSVKLRYRKNNVNLRKSVLISTFLYYTFNNYCMGMSFFTGLDRLVQVERLQLNLRLRALLVVREVMLSRSTCCYYLIVFIGKKLWK